MRKDNNNSTMSTLLFGAVAGALAVTLIDKDNRKRFRDSLINMINEGEHKIDELEDTVAEKAQKAKQKVKRARSGVKASLNSR